MYCYIHTYSSICLYIHAFTYYIRTYEGTSMYQYVFMHACTCTYMHVLAVVRSTQSNPVYLYSWRKLHEFHFNWSTNLFKKTKCLPHKPSQPMLVESKTHAGKSWKVAPICPNYLTRFLANTDVIWCDIGESIQSRFAMFAFSPFSPGFGRTNMQRSQGMVLAHRHIWCSQTLWAATTTAAYIKSRVWLMTRGW